MQKKLLHDGSRFIEKEHNMNVHEDDNHEDGVSEIWRIVAWVTRPERPKGVKDEVKQARRAQSRPEGPQTRSRGPTGP